MILTGYLAPDSCPTNMSPSIKSPSRDPTSRMKDLTFHLFTLAVVLLAVPITTSLNRYVPIPALTGGDIAMVGADVYPIPASVI